MDEAFQDGSGYGLGGRSSSLDTYPSSNKPKPDEDIMTRWYGQDSKK